MVPFAIKDVPNIPLITCTTGRKLRKIAIKDRDGQVLEFHLFNVEPNRRDRHVEPNRWNC